jgi:hypothetical protein
MNTDNLYFGIYRGVVKNNRDPKNQRRLKVSIPQLTGTEITDWIDSVEPANLSVDVPVIGQGVWIQFIGGSLNYPIWIGSFGKNQGKNKKIFIKPLANTTSLTGLSAHIITVKKFDGTTEVDLTATVMALANKVKTLETNLTTVKNTLATRTAGGHTHGSNG